MRALRFYGKEDLRLDQIEEPLVKQGWVKIAPAYAGICGTDLHEYLGGHNLVPAPGHPHIITHEESPCTLGHEFSGVVEEVGEGVTKYKPGDRVVVQPSIYCGECYACKKGLVQCCPKGGFIGLSGWGGAFSDHITAPENLCFAIPENVTLEHAALVEPLSVGWHAVEISPIPHPIPASYNLLVLGGGPIGLATIQGIFAQAESAINKPTIIVSEPSPARQTFAKDFGAQHVINPLKTDLFAEVMKLTSGVGVDCVLDCAGVQSGLMEGFHCVKPRGTVMEIAVWEKNPAVDINEVLFREKSFMGVASYDNSVFGSVLKAMGEGRIKPQKMITKKVTLEDAVEGGFKSLIAEKDKHVKVLVEVGGDKAGRK